ncbi:hypothetical protein TanjilG_11192 [Lupinus angustifolius]|uniref:Laccase n=2 Tax=Lupinus angustifolius TaxID=3871 RepID=A0A1J7H757_LUPAN|nr:hypothetical protein TanjilG_11192 [Lupinus angustifolius]
MAYGSNSGESTRFYDFKVQTKTIAKLCSSKDIVTINGMFPGPVVYAQEDDRIIVKDTNKTPFNVTIHWHGVRQKLSCWYDGPSFITQCPIQAGQSFTYSFTVVKQKDTFFWHAHVSWLRGTVYGTMIVYPKIMVPYPFKVPYQEQIIILGEYWLQDLQHIEKATIASGGAPPTADAYTINGHLGPNCQAMKNGVLTASMNNISFVHPNISILEAYYKKIKGSYTEDFPDVPPKFYDFVYGAPNNITYDTQSLNGTRTKVLEYGSRVQIIMQNTGTVNIENHLIHFHGYSFYVVGYGTGNYNPLTAEFNLVDPPYMNTIGVLVSGWAVIRFVADNPGINLNVYFISVLLFLPLSYLVQGYPPIISPPSARASVPHFLAHW